MTFEEEYSIWAYDIETYPNYLLLVFKNLATGKFIVFSDSSKYEGLNISDFVMNKTLVGFNSSHFDDIILSYLLNALEKGTSKEKIYQDVSNITDSIIVERSNTFSVKSAYSLPYKETRFNSIDLMNLTPLKISLKISGARLHYQKLQELPIEPGTILSQEQKDLICDYCHNDVNVTEVVYKELRPQILMRKTLQDEYNYHDNPLLSRGDASLAEYVLIEEYIKIKYPSMSNWDARKEIKESRTAHTTESVIRYTSPDFITFQTEKYQKVKDFFEQAEFGISESNKLTSPDIPNFVTDCGLSYSLGAGGIHAITKNGSFVIPEGWRMSEFDFASLYPTTMLQGGFAPSHLDANIFLDIFNRIVMGRIDAKHNGRKMEADAKKIIVNSAYGKLNEVFSLLYDPTMTLAVTATNQLLILMIIERLELIGVDCVSANTDAVVTLYPEEKRQQILSIIDDMGRGVVKEKNGRFDFVLEETEYEKIISRDVNCYIGFTKDGKLKNKGGALLSETGLRHNPNCNVSVQAVEQYELNKTRFIDTIKNEKRLSQFLVVRKVKGGATYKGEKIGSVVRFYYSTECDEPIYYIQSGNKVPMSEGAKLVLDLPDTFPDDIDYAKYENLAVETYNDITVPCSLENSRIAKRYKDYGLSPCYLSRKGITLHEGDYCQTNETIATQTGNGSKKPERRTGIISVDSKLYKFDELGWTSAYKQTLKKTGLNVVFGGVTPIPDNHNFTKPLPYLPNELRETIYDSLTKTQRIKINLANRE